MVLFLIVVVLDTERERDIMGGVDSGANIRATITSVVDAIEAGLDISTYFCNKVWFATVPVCDWFTQI